MDLVQKAFERLARRTKGDPSYRIDPRLDGRAAVQIASRTAVNYARAQLLYRWRFASTRGPLFIGRNVTILHANRIHIGRNFKAEDYAEIQGLSRQGVRFGDGVTIGRNASIRPSSYYGNELGEGIEIGDGTSIGPNSWIGAAGFVRIGRNVMFGPRVTVLPENHNFRDLDRTMKAQGTTRLGITVEDDCWLGSNSVILDGVTLGRGTVVASGAVVTKSTERYSIVGGVPARLIKMRHAAGESQRNESELSRPAGKKRQVASPLGPTKHA